MLKVNLSFLKLTLLKVFYKAQDIVNVSKVGHGLMSAINVVKFDHILT